MAVIPKLWRVHSVEFVPDGQTAKNGTNLTVPAISSQRLVSNATVQKDIPSNKTFPQNGRIEFGAWDLEVTTMAARHCIGAFGNTLSACIGGGSPNLDSVVLYLADFDCNGQLSGSTNRIYTIQKGAAFLTGLQCDHRGDLSFTFRVSAVRGAAGDANAAVVLSAGTLPSEGQIDNGVYDQYERWTLGDDTDTAVNEVATGGKRSVSVDFGPSLRTEGADSDIADSILLIESFQPVVTATGIDPTWFSHLSAAGLQLGIEGAAVSAATGDSNTCLFKFRKRSGATFAAEASNWLQMAVNGIAHYSNLVSQSGLEPATADIQVDAIADSAFSEPIQFTQL